jgi:transcriptional regulator with GAF, ATPase, and Fis domain
VQSGEIQRVGADLPLYVDVRMVAATNRDLPPRSPPGGSAATCSTA